MMAVVIMVLFSLLRSAGMADIIAATVAASVIVRIYSSLSGMPMQTDCRRNVMALATDVFAEA